LADSLVIIPTYNEKENVSQIIAAVLDLDHDFHVLIVDDSSPDGTGDIVRAIQKENPAVHLLSRAGKEGLGKAYISGFKWAIEHKYDYIFEMDADFSHNPANLLDLYAACHTGGAHLSIGSRYTKGGGVENWPFDRLFLSYGASLYVRIITGMRVKDPTAGFVCYKREVLETIDLDKIRFVGYAFQIEMKYNAYKLGFKMHEVPITFKDREEGTSKMSSNIIGEAIKGVIAMRLSKIEPAQYKPTSQNVTGTLRSEA